MKVLISGGGIAGLTLAFWLEQKGHHPVIVERAPGLRTEGYMIDFFSSGYDVAERMGLLPALDQIHYPIPRLSFVDPDGRERYAVDYGRLRSLFDGRHFNFMRGDLERVLHASIKGRVDMRFGTTIEGFEQDEQHVLVRLSDCSWERFDLLVGADGLHSHVRRLAFGSGDRFERFLGYYTAAYILDDLPALGLDHGAFHTLTEPHRQVAIYPIRGGKLATFFIHEAERRLDAPSPEAARRELHAAYGGMRWIVPELLSRLDADVDLYFDAVSQIELPAWHRGRVVLVGDACQCVSLLAGQGASMAMAGAFILARELEATVGDVPAALSRYEAVLKPKIKLKQGAGREMARWFVPASRARLFLRDVMMRMSSWPLAAWALKRKLAAESVL